MWYTVSVEAAFRHAAHRATSVGKLATLILFIWLVKHVGVTVSRGLATTADGRQVASVALHRGAGSALREVTDVELRVELGQVVACIAHEGLLAHVAYTA